MATKLCEFMILDGNGDVNYISLPVEWDYQFYPGNISGLPENCFPDSEESEIYIDNVEQVITNINPSIAIKNITLIQSQLEDLASNLPEWAAEKGDDYDE